MALAREPGEGVTDEDVIRRMREIDAENKRFRDPEQWHEAADGLLLDCLGRPLSAKTVAKLKKWWFDGIRWYG